MVLLQITKKICQSILILIGVSFSLYAYEDDAIKVATETLTIWADGFNACDMDRFAATEHSEMSGYLAFKQEVFKTTPESALQKLKARKKFCSDGGHQNLSTQLINAEFIGEAIAVTTKLQMSGTSGDGKSFSRKMILTAILINVNGTWLSRYEHVQLDNEDVKQ